MKRKTLWNCLCSSSSPRSSARFIRNIGEFGAKKYSIDHQTANTIQLFTRIKRKFFGSILFLNKSQRRGIPQGLLDKYSHLFICRFYCLHCQNPNIRINRLCCSALLWTSFFCRLISKGALEWFLLIIYKNILWPDLQNFSEEIIPHFLFLIQKRRSEDAHHWTVTLSNWQKQPPEVFSKKSSSEKCHNIHRKTPVLKSLLGQGWNKVAARKACNFIKKRLQHRCFPVNIAKFLITPVLKNICVRLLLKIIKKDFLEKPPVTMIIAW